MAQEAHVRCLTLLLHAGRPVSAACIGRTLRSTMGPGDAVCTMGLRELLGTVGTMVFWGIMG